MNGLHRGALFAVTVALQAVAAWVPLSMWHRMGHRFAYSIRVYGWTGELLTLLVIVGLPALGLWVAWRRAQAQATPWRAWVSYLAGLGPALLLWLMAIVFTGMLGIH